MLRRQRAIEIVPSSKPLRWRRYDVPQHLAPETSDALRFCAGSGSPSASPSASNGGGGGGGQYAAWAPGVAYTIGNRVSYGGLNYECRQSHTSIVSWEPPNTPALWLQI